MTVKPELGEKLIRYRKLYVGLIVFLIILMTLLFNLGSWIFLNRMENDLDKELGKRLQSVASVTAYLIQKQFGASAKDQFPFYFGELKEILHEIKIENQLQSVLIINEDFDVIADHDKSSLALPGKRTDLQADSVSLDFAWNGVAAAAQLHLIEGDYFKSAYAPIINDDQEIMAILVVEAHARFFNTLRFFKQGLIISGLISLVVLTLFSIFLYWAISLLLNSYERARRSERLALMGQMAASMAHEIRNPLGIIKGTADVLRELYDNSESPNELFDFIPAEIKRLNRLVNDFLTFARGVNLEKRTADLATVIKQVGADLEREQRDHQLEIKYHLPDKVQSFDFDYDAVYRVLSNLALNAIQAMDQDGTLTFTLEKFTEPDKSYYAVHVRDTGPGISGDLNKIFDPFFTTKTKGTGLGLAICRQIIEKHGGWIQAKNLPEQGARVSFFLPF